jgi:outer membrane biosynthesis protein TonB
MPNVVPVHAIARPGSTARSVEVIVPGPAFQRKRVPGSSGPSSDAEPTSGFQLGQPSMSPRTSQTTSGGASIVVAALATAGAARSISICAAYA